jgi:hypothetical protein
MINMMLFNPENPGYMRPRSGKSWQFIGKELGVFSLRRSESGVGRSAFKGGGSVKRRPDEQTLVPPILRAKQKICAICANL